MAVVELAIRDYLKYIKAKNKNYNTDVQKAEIFAIGRDAKRFLESKESNYLANIDYRINMAETIRKRYKSEGEAISNLYYREIKKRKANDNVRID